MLLYNGLIKGIYYICLLVIFMYAVAMSFIRLWTAKILTSRQPNRGKFILYPSITFCPGYSYSNSSHNLIEEYHQWSALDLWFKTLNHSYTIGGV
jgi:hypothetical protein